MLVITGIFEDERFIPDTPVVIPQKKKVVVTIEEEKPVQHSILEKSFGMFSDGKLSSERFIKGKKQEKELEP
jgi:hypothetical protein